MKKLFVIALCIVSAAAFSKRCRRPQHCEEDECCVNYVLTPVFGGYCRELRKEGESCTPLTKKELQEPPDMYHYQCPCKEGLQCVAKHEVEIFGHIVKHKPRCVTPFANFTSRVGGDDNSIGEPDVEYV